MDLTALAALPDTTVVQPSSLYRSPPMGPPGQPDYVNAVCALATRLPAPRLLAHLQGIEDRHGRVRGPVRWGPRILDLDLLLYGDAELSGPDLTVPHPGLAENAPSCCTRSSRSRRIWRSRAWGRSRR